MLLKAFFNESDNSSLILRHPGNDSLFLLRADVFKFANNLISVFIEALYGLDCCRVDSIEFDARLMKVQNIIIKPFALNKEHLKLLLLSFVQALLDYLALVRSEDLIFTTGYRGEQSRLYRSLLTVRACQSLVRLFHLILFTRFDLIFYKKRIFLCKIYAWKI